jgi:zinc transport system substrate-binding protein
MRPACRRRRLVAWLGVLVIAAAACAPATGPPGPAARLLVVASIAPLADFARQVGGDRVEVVTLVPPGATPHTFELTPSRVQQVARVRLLVLNGVGLEYWADDLIQGAANPDLRVVDTSRGIPILEGEPDDPGGNPHLWLDPQQAMVQVGHIRDALAQADPAHAATYRANAARFISSVRPCGAQARSPVTWASRQRMAASRGPASGTTSRSSPQMIAPSKMACISAITRSRTPG